MGIKLKNTNNNLDLATKIQAVVVEGGYYTPEVDEEGNLSWKPSRESMEAVETVNITGPAGTPGKDGQDGAPGKDGKDGAQGPQGIQGIQGIPGKDGKDGAQGPQGPQGPAGKDGAPGKDGQDGLDGESGVYVGNTEPTDDSLIWINPLGDETAAFATEDYVDTKVADLATETFVIETVNSAFEEVENGAY